MAYMWWRSGLTGGAADDLDGIDGDEIAAGDICMVPDTTDKFIRIYVAEDPIGVAESSPEVIIPDSNAGTLGWRLYRAFASGLFMDSNDMPTTDPTVSGSESICMGDGCDNDGNNAAVLGGKANNITISGGSCDGAVIAGGENNDITDCDYGFVGGGYNNDITGSWACVIGGGQANDVTADNAAILGGKEGKAYLEGMQAHANGSFISPGDNQWGRVKVYNSTTDATQTELFLDGSSAQIVLQASRSYAFSIRVVARQVSGAAGTAGDSAFWNITGGIKRDGSNNTALIGTPQGTGTPGANDRDAAAAAWDVSVSADDANEALAIDVTGEVNKNIRWSATVEWEEVG